ncbi:MAG: RNA polymerase sigma factor SigB [Heyndrickxia sp.]
MGKLSQPKSLESDQVISLIKSFQKEGDQEIQEKLVRHFEKLVDSIARKYSKGNHYHEDIFQVGIIGLLGAMRRYDESFGKGFEAFAVPTIVGEIKRFLRDKTWSVHVPRRIKELGPKIKKAAEELTIELQRAPRINEIALRIDVSEEEVLEAMEMGKSYQSLSVDHSIESDSDGSTVTLLDIVGNVDNGYEKVDQRLVVDRALHVLSEQERQIIHYTYLENLSQKETGLKLGISQMHVSRLQRRAIKKLREAIFEEETTHSEKYLS